MANLRNAMLIAVIAATAIAAIAGYFVLGGSPARLLVDAGLAVALGIIVSFMMTPTIKRVDLLVEALRALARGDKQQRVNVDDFAGLSEVARAMNEVAISLTESDDPALGPVKAQPHPTFRTRPKPPIDNPRIDQGEDPELSDHPELGRVRVLKKKEQPVEQTMGEAISEAMATAQAKKKSAAQQSAAQASQQASSAQSSAQPSSAQSASAQSSSAQSSSAQSSSAQSGQASSAQSSSSSSQQGSAQSSSASGQTAQSSKDSAQESSVQSAKEPSSSAAAMSSAAASGNGKSNGKSRPEVAGVVGAASNDTSIDERPRSDVSGESGEGVGIPSRGELEALFAEFVATKKRHDENVADLDLEAFAQTIQGECERLIVAHQCKGVRFEVTVQDGEVSLRPRLLR